MLRIVFLGRAVGPVHGTLQAYVSGSEEPLPITYDGMVVSESTRIKKVDLGGEPDGEGESDSSDPGASDLSSSP